MPYKDPERKRQWEREHREQRNAKRRMQHWGGQSAPITPKRVPDPILRQEAKGDWEFAVAIGFALLICIGLLAAWGRVGASFDSGPSRPSA